MIKSLLKLAAVLIIGILIYNYFLGTDSEKENSKMIFQEVKDVGRAVGDLLKNEKEKFDEGKYDNALHKIEDLFGELKQKAKDNKDILEKITDLENKRDDLEDKLAEMKPDEYANDEKFTEKGIRDSRDEAEMKRELEKLLKKTEKLIEEMKLEE